LADTVNVPVLGPTNKATVIGGTAAIVAVGGYLLWKRNLNKKAAAAAAATHAGMGYGYGMQNMGYGAYGYSYGSGAYGGYGYAGFSEITPYPSGEEYGYGAYGYGYYNPYTGQYIGGGTGTGVITPVTGTATTNAAWAANAANALEQQGYSALAVYQALGLYLAGLPLSAQQYQIVTAAIGAAGEPPTPVPSPIQSGTSGGGTGGGQTGGPYAAPSGLRVTKASATSVVVSWHPVSGATNYEVQITPKDSAAHAIGNRTSYNVGGLAKNKAYVAHVSAGPNSPFATAAFHT
jgi:Fibronectin type III domain